jgi:integrase/recombinase XerD
VPTSANHIPGDSAAGCEVPVCHDSAAHRGVSGHVAEFAKHFHRSTDQLGPEDIRQDRLFLIQEKKLAGSSYNQIVRALRFFYAKRLEARVPTAGDSFPRMEQRLPTMLSREEVARTLTLPPHLKTRARLMAIYATGLRRSAECAVGASTNRMIVLA